MAEKFTKKGLVTGEVVRLSSPKTIVVSVSRLWQHPIYKKAIRRTKRYLVHNENTDLKPGDKVLIKETKPISKRKYYVVVSKSV